jgi:large subunit ribosomal protein L6
MSRVGKQIIEIPKKVELSFKDKELSVSGPMGNLTRIFRSEIDIQVNDQDVILKPAEESVFAWALWGTYASHIQNMIMGVTKGFEKKLIIEGIGFKASLVGDKLVLDLGFSHSIEMLIPKDIKVSVEKNIITVFGIDKEKVGELAARIRANKKTEPYKGKGIRYIDEIVRRKQGKKTVS